MLDRSECSEKVQSRKSTEWEACFILSQVTREKNDVQEGGRSQARGRLRKEEPGVPPRHRKGKETSMAAQYNRRNELELASERWEPRLVCCVGDQLSS
jgi:hypothetical protein